MKESLYIYNSGTLLRKDNTLRFINQNNEKKDIPIERYSDIYIFGEVTVNSALLNILSQYGINIHFFNYYSFYTGSFYSREQLLAGQLLVNIRRVLYSLFKINLLIYNNIPCIIIYFANISLIPHKLRNILRTINIFPE